MNHSQHMAEQIKQICKSKKISIKQFLSDCSLTKSFIYDLEKRNISPSCDKAIRIAEYLGCSLDDLLGVAQDHIEIKSEQPTQKKVDAEIVSFIQDHHAEIEKIIHAIVNR